MRKICLLVALAAFSPAQAEQTYLGMYMNGSKIGYSSYASHPDMLSGVRVNRSDSRTVMGAGLLGQAMSLTIDGSTWTNATSKPLKMLFVMTSAGRTQKVVAIFGPKTAEVDVVNAGQKTHKSLLIPKDGTIVDDPLTLMVNSRAAPGARRIVWVLDPTTVTFLRNEVVLVGKRQTTVRNKQVTATQVDIIDPRATMNVFVSAKGDLIKANGPMGIEMLPETREVALKMGGDGYKPSADLAFATSIKTDKPITDPTTLTSLSLRITGRDLSKVPTDGYQTVKKDGGSWLVTIHPPKNFGDILMPIKQAAKGKEQWLKATLHMPSGRPTFTNLAAKIVKGHADTLSAALAIKAYVNGAMHANAGIGVLRDASEVLSSKEGVCRDYAILTATLMRSAGIPAKLASGIVNWEGDFYYHAWVEIWNGTRWIGIDSTVPQEQISAAHVKLAEGNVEEAFAFTFLDKVKIEVLDAQRG